MRSCFPVRQQLGKYPVDALQMMAEIAEMTEPHLDYKVFIEHRSMDGREKISSAVALATVRTAKNLKANAIVTPTMSGNTARLISNFRPKVPIYAITPNSTITAQTSADLGCNTSERISERYHGPYHVSGYECCPQPSSDP